MATVQALVIVAKRDKQEAVALAAKIRAAARLAESLRERPRRQRYLDACARGVALLDALVIP